MTDWLSQVGSYFAHAKILEAGHADEWITGATGFFGAVLGAIITVGWTDHIAKATRKRDTRNRWRTAGFAVYHKLNHIASTSRQIRRHTEEGLKGKTPPFLNGRMSLNMKAGKFDQTRIDITIEERMAMLETAGIKLINKLAALDNSFNHLLSSVEEYANVRQELFDQIQPDEFEDGVGQILTTTIQKHDPKLYELDLIIEQSYRMASQIENDALEALKMLVYARGKPLGPKFQVSFPGPDGQAIILRAADAPKPRRWSEFVERTRRLLGAKRGADPLSG